jgi:hypothetical protein
MFELIGLAVAGVALVGGYIQTRSFVKRRLRYVDGVQKSSIPVIAGAAAAAVAIPFAWILPLVGAPAVLAIGAGVGLGTRAGVRDIRNGSD